MNEPSCTLRRYTTVPLIPYTPAASIQVAQWLLERDFGIAAGVGIAVEGLTVRDEIGVLSGRKAPGRKTSWDFFGPPRRREFIGVVWFNNSHRGATSRRWVFEVYGRKHLAAIRDMATEMSRAFDVAVTTRLVDEMTRLEAYFSDFRW